MSKYNREKYLELPEEELISEIEALSNQNAFMNKAFLEQEEKLRLSDNRVTNFKRVVGAYLKSSDPAYKAVGIIAMEELIE